MSRQVDLTLEQYEGNPTHPGHGRTPLILPGTVSHGVTHMRQIVNVYDGSPVSVANELVLLTGHTGTHVDAPTHVDHKSDISAEKLPVSRTSGPAIWLDLSEFGSPGAVIDADDLAAAERDGGHNIERGDIVLVRTGWIDAHSHDVETCLSQSPGLTKDAGDWLRNKQIKAIGVDLMSPDQRDALDLPIHMNFLRPRSIGGDSDDYILIYESLCNISEIGARRFFFWGLPLPIRGATGSPVRAVAVVEEAELGLERRASG